ncbi:hypothetical protein L0152_14470 [bacterium]|nr:hypothetical protein [bacterium]
MKHVEGPRTQFSKIYEVIKSFTQKKIIYCVLLAFITLTCRPEAPSSRPFLMGFSASGHERTPWAKNETKEFLSQYSELVLEDFVEGVPWEESLRGQPLPPEVMVSVRIRKRTLKKKKIILHVSPLNSTRTNLAASWPPAMIGDTVKAAWSVKKFGNPELQAAYLTFCLELIRLFRPMYFGYAFDVNQFASTNPGQWSGFVDFSKYVYQGLKKEHPNLPIFVSFDACAFWSQPDFHEKRIREMLPHSDFLAVSAHPHLCGFNDLTRLPRDFFARLVKISSQKPFAIADAGYPHPPSNNGTNNENHQKRYLEFVFKESDKLRAEFVIWFHYRDFGKVIEKLKLEKRDPRLIALFEPRKNCGLIDDAGNEKNSYTVWKDWLKLPVVKKK